jgi:hypothetical protein
MHSNFTLPTKRRKTVKVVLDMGHRACVKSEADYCRAVKVFLEDLRCIALTIRGGGAQELKPLVKFIRFI